MGSPIRRPKAVTLIQERDAMAGLGNLAAVVRFEEYAAEPDGDSLRLYYLDANGDRKWHLAGPVIVDGVPVSAGM